METDLILKSVSVTRELQPPRGALGRTTRQLSFVSESSAAKSSVRLHRNDTGIEVPFCW
jgi:hypothetical protein